MITAFEKASREGRGFLFEHEVYDLLRTAGIGAPLPYRLFAADGTGSVKGLAGDELVLKIVHPRILHKSDVGGVRIVPRKAAEKTARALLAEVPSRFARQIIRDGSVPADLAGLTPEKLEKRIRAETVGVLAVPRVSAASGFGRELLAGIRLTREFGTVVTAGLGGLDTELYARELKPGRSVVSAGAAEEDFNGFWERFRRTPAFLKLTGKTRDRLAVSEETSLRGLLKKLHTLARKHSPLNPKARFWISEFEVNPFLFRKGKAVPVDGLLRFEPARPLAKTPDLGALENLLRPKRILILGASAKSMNVGRIILNNLLRDGISAERILLVREDGQAVDGVSAVRSISEIPAPVDLAIVAIPAPDASQAIRDLTDGEKARSILLITGGMGETERGKGIEREIREILTRRRESGKPAPVMVGGNSLGIVSRPGGYDTLFIPDSRLPRNANLPLGKNTALIAQSGAFLITRMSGMGGFVPRYAISTGNQVDLGVSDFLEHLVTDPEISTFGLYIEGFRDFEGTRLVRAVREAVRLGKDVIIYKAGRTAAGKKAASGHTAAIAGDYPVAVELLRDAGALVAHTFENSADFLLLSSLLAGRPAGNGGVGAASNAGFETVGAADQMDPDRSALHMATLAPETKERLQKMFAASRLTGLQDIRNPLDLTPMAADGPHLETLRAFHADPGIDILVHGLVPLTVLVKTLNSEEADSFARLLIAAHREFRKPLVEVIDSGSLYDPLADALLAAGIPVFRSMDRALSALSAWVENRRRIAGTLRWKTSVPPGASILPCR